MFLLAQDHSHPIPCSVCTYTAILHSVYMRGQWWFFLSKGKNSPYLLGLIATSSAELQHSWVWMSWRSLNAAPPLAESTCWSVIAWLRDSYQLFTVCELSLSNKWYNCINTYFSTKHFNTRQVQVQMRPKGLWVNFKGQEFFRVHVV